MSAPTSSPSGLLGSLRGFADGLIGSVHDRIELVGIELQEEKYRLIQILFWVAGIVLLGLLALIFLSFALVLWLWETARIAAVCGLGIGYVFGLVFAIFSFRRYLARQPKPFAGTLGELKEDRACIQPEN